MKAIMRMAGVAAAALFTQAAPAQDAYVVGVTGAMTGPQAGILALVEMAGRMSAT